MTNKKLKEVKQKMLKRYERRLDEEILARVKKMKFGDTLEFTYEVRLIQDENI